MLHSYKISTIKRRQGVESCRNQNVICGWKFSFLDIDRHSLVFAMIIYIFSLLYWNYFIKLSKHYWEMTHGRSKGKVFRSTAKEYAATSTAHGVGYILEPGRLGIERGFFG